MAGTHTFAAWTFAARTFASQCWQGATYATAECYTLLERTGYGMMIPDGYMLAIGISEAGGIAIYFRPLEGPSQQYYVLSGSSAEFYALTGPS